MMMATALSAEGTLLSPLDPPAAPVWGPRVGRLWAKSWPPALAVVIALALWQLLVFLEVRPSYVLPGPIAVFERLSEMVTEPAFWIGVMTTMTRAVVGFALALVIGTVLGAIVARSAVARAAIGSLLSGLQTMPSIAWFPLAILFFGLTEQAILFVILLGAVPSIANGLISGIDDVPPQLVRAGHALGARGFTMLRRVILPAALPTYVAGLKQGWAFAWRSLLAGELLVTISQVTALGVMLSNARAFADAPTLLAVMIVVLVIGMLVDAAFSAIAGGLRRRRGLGAQRL